MSWTKEQSVDDELELGSGTTVVNTFAATKVNSLLLCATTWFGNETASIGTDSEGNVWVPVTRKEALSANQFIQIFHTHAETTGTPTVTVTWGSGVVYRGLPLTEMSHSSGGRGIFDTFKNNDDAAPGTGTDGLTTGTFTVAEDDSLIFAYAQNAVSLADILTAGTDCTLLANLESGGVDFGWSEFKEVDAGTREATYTLSVEQAMTITSATFSPPARIMSSLANHGGLAGMGGIAGNGGGLAG